MYFVTFESTPGLIIRVLKNCPLEHYKTYVPLSSYPI
jgi:hypothetical protein